MMTCGFPCFRYIGLSGLEGRVRLGEVEPCCGLEGLLLPSWRVGYGEAVIDIIRGWRSLGQEDDIQG